MGGGLHGGNYDPELERIVVNGLPKNPKIIYIDSGDSSAFAEFSQLYKTEFGYQVDLFSKGNRNELQQADLIYLGRGSTIRLMQLLKETDVDELLRKAYESGECTVAGFSAGANALFAMSVSNEEGKMKKVEGLGFLKDFVCTHFNYDDRKNAFLNEIGSNNGYGLDDHTMLIVDDEEYKAISVREGYTVSEYNKGKLL